MVSFEKCFKVPGSLAQINSFTDVCIGQVVPTIGKEGTRRCGIFQGVEFYHTIEDGGPVMLRPGELKERTYPNCYHHWIDPIETAEKSSSDRSDPWLVVVVKDEVYQQEIHVTGYAETAKPLFDAIVKEIEDNLPK
jgi:hypothetical protein